MLRDALRGPVLLCLLLAPASCQQSSSAADAAVDLRAADASAGDADASAEDGGSDGGAVLPADSYCERMVDAFCAFYLRCGRIAETTPAACRSTFLEVCNAVYEPRYAALAQRGLLELWGPGVEACATHLSGVTCEHQLVDISGPCRELWRGTAAAQAPCGLDLESFVCGPETTCVLDLTLCGECRATAATLSACGAAGPVCQPDDCCVSGSCTPRALPGAPCDAQQRCIAGASCRAGVCQAPTFVGLGQSCGDLLRCPYRSRCAAGSCQQTALLGQPCGEDADCASGACDDTGHCIALLAPAAPCTRNTQCLSRRCLQGSCDDLLSACLAP